MILSLSEWREDEKAFKVNLHGIDFQSHKQFKWKSYCHNCVLKITLFSIVHSIAFVCWLKGCKQIFSWIKPRS